MSMQGSNGRLDQKRHCGSREFLEKEMGVKIREDSASELNPSVVLEQNALSVMAIQYALSHGRKSVTLVHKGNIMKYTEGAFRDWGYELAKEEFGDKYFAGE